MEGAVCRSLKTLPGLQLAFHGEHIKCFKQNQMIKRIVDYLNDCQRMIVVDAQLRSKREQHASVVLLGQLFLLGGGWETKTIEVTIFLLGRLGDQDH